MPSTIVNRETQGEWESPSGQVTTLNIRTDLRPDALAPDYTTAFSYGPVEIGTFSSGSLTTVWKARAEENGNITTIYLSKAGTGSFQSESPLFAYTHSISGTLREMDIAFSEDARPLVCAELTNAISSSIFLYWFNPFSLAFEFRKFITSGSCPRVLLDNPQSVGPNDLLVFYVSGSETDKVFFVQQRDQYEIPYPVPIGTAPTASQQTYIEDVVKLDNSRVGVYYSRRTPQTATWEIFRADTVLYPFGISEDAMTSTVSLISGAVIPIIVYNATGALGLDGVDRTDGFQWISQSIRTTLFFYNLTGSLTLDGVDRTDGFQWITQSLITTLIPYSLTDTFHPPVLSIHTGSLLPTLISRNYTGDTLHNITLSITTSSLT